MPDLKHDHFALFDRKPGERPLRGFFEIVFDFSRLEPAGGFQFARDTPPQAPLEIQGPIAERAHAIMHRIVRRSLELKQSDESFLQDIFRFAFAQSQGAPVQ